MCTWVRVSVRATRLLSDFLTCTCFYLGAKGEGPPPAQCSHHYYGWALSSNRRLTRPIRQIGRQMLLRHLTVPAHSQRELSLQMPRKVVRKRSIKVNFQQPLYVTSCVCCLAEKRKQYPGKPLICKSFYLYLYIYFRCSIRGAETERGIVANRLEVTATKWPNSVQIRKY